MIYNNYNNYINLKILKNIIYGVSIYISSYIYRIKWDTYKKKKKKKK